jgi:hypothetical protein
MSRKTPRVNPLQLRKALLVAESELNRAQLIEECQAVAAGARIIGARVKHLMSFVSAGALVAAGVSALKRRGPAPQGAKSSWIGTAFKAAKIVGSLWMAFRARPR